MEEPAERIEVKAAIKVGNRELSDGKARKGQKIFLAVERHWEVGRVRDTGARNEMEPHVELILSVTQQPEEPAFAVHHGTNVL